MGKKLTHEHVFNYYKDRGYTLNSIYLNNRIKNDLTCPKNHNCFIAFDKFQANRRCIKCSAKRERLTHEYVFNYYASKNYKMLSIYNTCSDKDELICPEGHPWSTNFDNFKSKNNRCFTCHWEKNRGENHPSFLGDRTRRGRTNYLQFDSYHLHILKDDPLYESYIQSKIEAQESGKKHEKTKYTVDHIFPRVAFIDNDLDNIYGQTIIKEICNLRENLRIIPREENGSKGGKYTQDQFLQWFEEKLSEIKK